LFKLGKPLVEFGAFFSNSPNIDQFFQLWLLPTCLSILEAFESGVAESDHRYFSLEDFTQNLQKMSLWIH
jgi:hypothetical protein